MSEDIDELKKRREERRRQQEEEEKREAEEKQRREEERKARRAGRDKKKEEREAALAQELEEMRKREQKEEEKRKKKEERERARLEEERLEKEEHDRKQREKERKRQQEEVEDEVRRTRREDLRKSMDLSSLQDNREVAKPDSRRKARIDELLNIINTQDGTTAVAKIISNDDLREEATKLLSEQHAVVGDFFSKQNAVVAIVRCIVDVHPDPLKLTEEELRDLKGRIEFAGEAICGGVPSLWRALLASQQYLELLFSLFHNDTAVLPPINVTTFWSSVEYLLGRRSYEVSGFMYARRATLLADFFKHLRDPRVIDILFKFIEKEAGPNAAYRDFDPKKESAANDCLFWTDDLTEQIIAFLDREDTEWTDVEIENIAELLRLVVAKFPTCKLIYQIKDPKFCSRLITRALTIRPHKTGEGAHRSAFRHQTTLLSVLNFIAQLLHFSVNTASYSSESIPPIVASLVYGTEGKGCPLEHCPVQVIKAWLMNQPPDFDFPVAHKKTGPKTFSILRVKCLHLLKALFYTNYQCVDVLLRDIGVLRALIDLFFEYVDNNIVHSIVEDIVKMFITREASSLAADNTTQITQHLLDDCDLVERLVAALRTVSNNRSKPSVPKPSPSPPPADDTPVANGKRASTSSLMPPKPTWMVAKAPKPAPAAAAVPEKEKVAKVAQPEKERTNLPPAFVGHVLSICKAITHAAEKSAEVRHLIASCSGYHWGPTVMFHLGMTHSADMEWKQPFQKPDAQDGGTPAAAARGPDAS